MSACEQMKERLLLHVHGELDPEQRMELVAHLEGCSACRREADQLQGLLERCKHEAAVPPLAGSETERLIHRVSGELREKSGRTKWIPGIPGSPARWIPLAAAACMFVLLGVLTLQGVKEELPFLTGKPEHLTQEEREIIENMDILKNMETIQKLVRTVDRPTPPTPNQSKELDTHGLRQRHQVPRYA